MRIRGFGTCGTAFANRCDANECFRLAQRNVFLWDLCGRTIGETRTDFG